MIEDPKVPLLLRRENQAPIGLTSVGNLLAEARAAGLNATVVLYPDDHNATQALMRRSHDVRASLRTLDLSVKALTAGYRFDDGQAEAKIAAMMRAVQCLQREIDLLSEVLKPE